jgi:hypothetical protein
LLGDVDYTTGATLGTRHGAHILGIEINVDAFHTSLHTCRKTGLFRAQAGCLSKGTHWHRSNYII